MRYIKTIVTLIELITILIALTIPTIFIAQTASVIASLTATGAQPFSYAYGLAIVFICAVGSSTRKWVNMHVEKISSKATTLLSCATVIVAMIMFYSIISNDLHQGLPAQVATPYLSYWTSIFFCMGVGYAIADLFSFFIIKE